MKGKETHDNMHILINTEKQKHLEAFRCCFKCTCHVLPPVWQQSQGIIFVDKFMQQISNFLDSNITRKFVIDLHLTGLSTEQILETIFASANVQQNPSKKKIIKERVLYEI